MCVVIPERHACIEAHLRDRLDTPVVHRICRAVADLTGNVVGNHRRLVMACPTGFAHGQINGVTDDVDILQAIHLKRFVMGWQPAFVVLGL